MLSAHPHAALEYWFFKVNIGSTAILVDWIARRPATELELRVSVHTDTPERHEVLNQNVTTLTLTETRTTGQIADIAWDLDIDTYQTWLAPDIFPARASRMTDLTIVSAPLARFTGWLLIGETRFLLYKTAGMVSHYWGRQLAPQWWWISANQFEQSNLAFECSVSRSHLWGSPVQIPLAYWYLHDGNRGKLWMSPPARVQVSGTPEKFEIRFKPLLGAPLTIRASGQQYNPLGDNILNTLIGNLEIYRGDELLGRAVGTAGLERRSDLK